MNVVDGATTRAFGVRVHDLDLATTSTSNVNVVCVKEPILENSEPTQALSAVSSPPPPTGFITEKFYADTGANRSLHPNGRSAVTYYRQTLDISKVNVGKTIQSEAVGKCFSRLLMVSISGIRQGGFCEKYF